MYTKQASTKPTYQTSDREIQGTKEALIHDLERKLRGKDSLLHNGNPVRENPLSAKNPITLNFIRGLLAIQRHAKAFPLAGVPVIKKREPNTHNKHESACGQSVSPPYSHLCD